MTIGTGEGVPMGQGQEEIDPKLVEKAREINPTITPPDKIDVAALRKSFENMKKNMAPPEAKPEAGSGTQQTPTTPQPQQK